MMAGWKLAIASSDFLLLRLSPAVHHCLNSAAIGIVRWEPRPRCLWDQNSSCDGGHLSRSPPPRYLIMQRLANSEPVTQTSGEGFSGAMSPSSPLILENSFVECEYSRMHFRFWELFQISVWKCFVYAWNNSFFSSITFHIKFRLFLHFWWEILRV